MTDESAVDRPITVHQAVHGYRDGHELLSTSLPSLPEKARRLMSVLSDLSGDGIYKGFKEYLTGYPIDEPGLFAFARTWYAEEMERPGCVWTHTLLIEFSDLARLHSLAELRQYFRHPGEADRSECSHSVIEHPVANRVSMPASEDVRERIDKRARATLRALYGQAAPVLLPASRSARFEELVLRIWDQQWPRLRRSFAFCTGSLASRTIGRRPFDLQVVPRQRCKSIARSASNSVVVESKSSSPENELDESLSDERWLQLALVDLYQPDLKLRKFLRAYGADVSGERQSFRALVKSFLLVNEPTRGEEQLRDLTGYLAQAFPTADQARTLKHTYLGPNRTESDLVGDACESTLLRVLLTCPSESAFDLSDLDFETRARAVFRPSEVWDPEPLTWLTGTSELNSAGRRILEDIVGSLTVEELCGVFAENRDLFVRLIARHPERATDQTLWEQPREFQRACLQALEGSLSPEKRPAVVAAMVRANATGVGEELFEKLGADTVPDLLSALDVQYREGARVDETRWSVALREHQEAACSWLTQGSDVRSTGIVLLVATVLGSRSSLLTEPLREMLRDHLLNVRSTEGSSSAYAELAALALAIAFGQTGGSGGRLASAAFEPVHEAAMASALSWRAWGWLEPLLPRADWFSFFDWDRAEKLRRGLVDRFLQHSWAPELLDQAVSNSTTKERIVNYCRQIPGGRRLAQASGLQ